MSNAMSNARIHYHHRVRSILDVARSNIKTFTDELAKNPAHAMEWSDAAFKAAAKIAVLTQVEEVLAEPDSAVSLENVRDSLHDRFMHSTRYIDNRSSSPSTNRMNDCCVSVLSEELKDLNRLLKVSA